MLSIANLPYDILLHVFNLSIDIPQSQRPHGGKLASWDDNASLTNLRLVCKGWSQASIDALYRSVAIFDKHAAKSFLQTLSADQLRKQQIRFLVLGLSENGPEGTTLGEDDERMLDESVDLVEIIRLAAPSLTHLHLHPVHKLVRVELLKAIKSCHRLRSLVCAPRFNNPLAGWIGNTMEVASWGSGTFQEYDPIELALPPPLQTLELDFEAPWNATERVSLEPSQDLSLKKLALNCNTNEEVLWNILKACKELVVIDLYFERLLDRDQTTGALFNSVETTEHLTFLSNPTVADLDNFDLEAVPIFDRLLPHYTRLTSLTVSATEVSTAVFSLIPPSLRSLTIQAFNHVSRFKAAPRILEDLRNVRIELPNLKDLYLWDSAEAWAATDIKQLDEACQSRGITFTFHPDSELSSLESE